MLPRTQRQKEVLDYITRFLAKHGHEPSYAQIARYFGVSSKATIAKHISALEKRGLIEREHQPGRFRLKVEVEEASPDAVCEVTLVGRIAAGAPIDAIEDIERSACRASYSGASARSGSMRCESKVIR